MKITTIRYRRLRSHDHGYGHDAIEVEAQVEAEETASHALQELKAWVLARLEEGTQAERLTRTEEIAQRAVDRLQKLRESLEERVRLGEAVLSRFDTLGDLAEKAGLTEALSALETAGVADRIPF